MQPKCVFILLLLLSAQAQAACTAGCPDNWLPDFGVVCIDPAQPCACGIIPPGNVQCVANGSVPSCGAGTVIDCPSCTCFTVTPGPSPTPTITPTVTQTGTITPTPTITLTITPGPSPTATKTPTVTPTATITPTATLTRTAGAVTPTPQCMSDLDCGYNDGCHLVACTTDGRCVQATACAHCQPFPGLCPQPTGTPTRVPTITPTRRAPTFTRASTSTRAPTEHP